MNNWLNVGISGTAIWPTVETEILFGGYELILRPATSTTSQSIHVDLHGISDVDALTLINRFLSILSWCDDQPIENKYGWSGNPIPVSVPLEPRWFGSSIAFPFYRELDSNPKAQLALALYREARTINSIPLSFLSYFKILNIFWQDRWQSINGKKQNPIIEGIRSSLATIIDTSASERISKLSIIHHDVAIYLYESCRCAVAHANTNPVVDPDNVSDLRRLSEDIYIVKVISEHLISVQFNLSRSIIQ